MLYVSNQNLVILTAEAAASSSFAQSFGRFETYPPVPVPYGTVPYGTVPYRYFIVVLLGSAMERDILYLPPPMTMITIAR